MARIDILGSVTDKYLEVKLDASSDRYAWKPYTKKAL
jgi:hypothetical protein